MNPPSPPPSDNTRAFMQQVVEEQQELPADFLPKLRRKIHARVVTAQAASFSWDVPALTAITMIEVFSHLVTDSFRKRKS
jgi:hypothetical protein